MQRQSTLMPSQSTLLARARDAQMLVCMHWCVRACAVLAWVDVCAYSRCARVKARTKKASSIMLEIK